MSTSGLMECRGCVVRMRTGFVAMIVLAASGCAMMGGANLTDDEKTLRTDSQAFNETVIGGAAAGAGVAALGCMLFGSDLTDCLPAVAVGGVVGAASGYAVASKQRAAKQQVDEIEIVTGDIEVDNERLTTLVASARNVLDENRAAVEALKTRIASNEAEAGEIEALQAKLRSNVDVLNNTIGKLNERRDTYAEAAASLDGEGKNTTALRQKVREMEDQIAQLVQYRSALEEEIDVELMG